MTSSSSPPGAALDAGAWLVRWERQQELYVPERESTFGLMLDVVDRLGAAPGRLVDLGCGPGSLAARALSRWPRAEVIGLDLDPVLLDLGRRAHGTEVTWVERDLRTPSWWGRLARPVDAILSATALHWLGPHHLDDLARGMAELLRPDGVLLTYDTMDLDAATPRLRALGQDLRRALSAAALERGPEDWSSWWAALRAEPELAEAFRERARRFGHDRAGSGFSLTEAARALHVAGFREVATLKQVANRHLLVAIR